MGFFDFFKTPRTHGSEKLRDALFAAIEAEDWRVLAELCNEHTDEIVRAFEGWKSAPKTMRKDADALQRYGRSMATLAEYFLKVRGENDLVKQLVGPEESNPIYKWNKLLDEALELMEATRYQEVIPTMTGLLTELERYRGDSLGYYLARANGHLGSSYFHTGCADQAVEPLGKALALCREQGDAEGHRIYLETLFEVHRYLGQGEPAANYAQELAEFHAKQGDGERAAWYRKQAAIVRAGEPLVRLIAVVNNQYLEMEEVTLKTDLRVDYIFYRNRMTLAPSRRFQLEAKKTWAQGQAKETMDNLFAAIAADGYDPDPFYQMGVVVLYSSMFGAAVACFQKTEELAPGWQYCRRFLWLAQQLANGTLELDTFFCLQELDDNPGGKTLEEKVALARDALGKTPHVAWLYLCLGSDLRQLDRKLEAETAFRQGLEVADEPDVKSCLMLNLAALLDAPSDERTRLFNDIRSLNGNLNATATATLLLKFDATRA